MRWLHGRLCAPIHPAAQLSQARSLPWPRQPTYDRRKGADPPAFNFQAPSGTLTFEASSSELTAESRLTAAFLRSYEGMGRARLWLDDDYHHGLTLNGSWGAPTSQTDLAIMGVASLCGPSCLARRHQQARHRIRVRRLPADAGGHPNKFKLLLLELC